MPREDVKMFNSKVITCYAKDFKAFKCYAICTFWMADSANKPGIVSHSVEMNLHEEMHIYALCFKQELTTHTAIGKSIHVKPNCNKHDNTATPTAKIPVFSGRAWIVNRGVGTDLLGPAKTLLTTKGACHVPRKDFKTTAT